MPSFSDIDLRVKSEGKDYLNQYAAERAIFIQDTCFHISTSLDYYWQKETLTPTVPSVKTDWFELHRNFHAAKLVQFGNRTFTFISEEDYGYEYYQVTSSSEGRYRIRYNNTKNVWEMALVNGPPAGSQLVVIIKKLFKDPEDFPQEFEEAIVCGAVARFAEFLEGDDLEFSQQKFNRYSDLTNTQHKNGSNKVAGTPRRTKTYKELNDSRLNVYVGE